MLELGIIDDLALAMIAFTAGGEISIEKLKKNGIGIFSIAALQAMSAFVVVAGGVFLFFTTVYSFGLSMAQSAAIGIMCGVIAQANSPATAIAVIVESRAKGPMTDLVIGVTVLKDVLVMLCFALALAFVASLSPSGAAGHASVGMAAVEIVLSFVAGGIVGGAIALFLRFFKRETVLFMITVSFLIVYICQLAHIHFLLVCLVAGFVVENWTDVGHRLVEAVERTSMAVYIVFFALAGASINMSALGHVWKIALVIVVLRAFGMMIGTYAGGRLAGEGTLFNRYGWLGFMSQAGVSLGLAATVSKVFPEWGATFRTIVISVIAIDQIIGPVLLKTFLGFSGETAEKHIVHKLRAALRARLG